MNIKEAHSHNTPKLTIGTKWYRVILFIVVIAAYANTFHHDYVLDDLAVITSNTYVSKGVSGIPDILSTPSLSGFSGRVIGDTVAKNDIYRPISLITFAVEHQLFDSSSTVAHVINVLLFACCVLLLFSFIDRVFERKKTIIAFLAALLFAVHPIHTEVVANVKSRDELLCFFLAFGALLLFHKYSVRNSISLLAAGACCFFLSLLSKETSIVFIGIIPLLFFGYVPATRRQKTWIVLFSALAAALYVGIRFYILNAYNANHPGLIDFMENPLVDAPSSSSRIATAIVVMGQYIKLLFVPYPLSCDYTFASIPFVYFNNAGVWLSIIVHVALVGIAIYRLATKRADIYLLGILFYLFSMALFTNIPFLTGAIMAERFLFFASVGFCLVIAAFLWWMSSKVRFANSLWLMCVPITLLLAGMTISRNAEWKDNYTLANADVQKYPQNARLWHSVGYILTTQKAGEAGSSTDKKDLLLEGINCMRTSLSIYPKQLKVHADISNAFVQLGGFDSAEKHMQMALSLQPTDAVLLSSLGGIYFAQQKYAQTLTMCRLALEQLPGNVAVTNNMALCYLQLAKYDSAVYLSQQVLRTEPGDALARSTLEAANKGLGSAAMK